MGSFGGLGFMFCQSISEKLPKPKTGVAVSSFSFPFFFYKKNKIIRERMGSTRLEWSHTCNFNCHGQIMSCHVNVSCPNHCSQTSPRERHYSKTRPRPKSYQPRIQTRLSFVLDRPCRLPRQTHMTPWDNSRSKWHYHNLDEI